MQAPLHRWRGFLPVTDEGCVVQSAAVAAGDRGTDWAERGT